MCDVTFYGLAQGCPWISRYLSNLIVDVANLHRANYCFPVSNAMSAYCSHFPSFASSILYSQVGSLEPNPKCQILGTRKKKHFGSAYRFLNCMYLPGPAYVTTSCTTQQPVHLFRRDLACMVNLAKMSRDKRSKVWLYFTLKNTTTKRQSVPHLGSSPNI